MDSNICHIYSWTPHSITCCTLILDHAIRGTKSAYIYNSQWRILWNHARLTNAYPAYQWERNATRIAS